MTMKCYRYVLLIALMCIIFAYRVGKDVQRQLWLEGIASICVHHKAPLDCMYQVYRNAR